MDATSLVALLAGSSALTSALGTLVQPLARYLVGSSTWHQDRLVIRGRDGVTIELSPATDEKMDEKTVRDLVAILEKRLHEPARDRS
jgi:hypothetical protein